jgi:soluble lytic murein transglycosylase
MSRFSLVLICALLATPLAAQPDAAADPQAAVRTRFVAAYEAAALGTDTADDAALEGYVLYPYVQAARIERELDLAAGAWGAFDEAAADFVSAHGAEPVGRALRRAWLSSLARRAQWRAYLDRYDTAIAPAALECEYFNARIALGEVDDLAPAIAARWRTPYQLPRECEPAFQWLRAEGVLTDALVAERATLLLDHGQTAFARVIARRLPSQAGDALLERADFIEQPARMLDALLADPARAASDEAVLDAWSRLARNDPDAALMRFAPLATPAAAERASDLSLALALGLAWDRRPQALEYFARVPRGRLDGPALEWLARAALWAGAWTTAAEAIAWMPPELQASSAWRYWAARAAFELGDRDTARALYTSVLGDDNYYSAMAAARLGDRVVPRTEPLPVALALVDAIATGDAFVRARELQLAGLRDLATLEWHHGYETLGDELKLQAIHLAASFEMHDVAVATATSHGVFNDYELLYPRPYGSEMTAAVELTSIESPLLYALLRQESLFRPDVASPAGALGIAQLDPDTARRTARRWQLPVPSRVALFDPAISIPLGAARLAELLEQFDEQLPVALAAYNAGENTAERWLPDEAIDSDIWIENIPYNETRAYVRRVLWHSLVFEWLDTNRPQSTRDWLGEIKR